MRRIKRNNSCIPNLLYTNFNEDIGGTEFFYYDLEYPTFYTFSNLPFSVSSNILKSLNSTIKSDVYTFKDGMMEEEIEFNASIQEKNTFRVFTYFATTFNKNNVLSTILNLMTSVKNYGRVYDQINNYNLDLLTGKTLLLKDIFKNDVDYIEVVTKYVNYKINQNKDLFYEDVVIEIPEDQAFYLTNEGIVIYFDIEQIAPRATGIPKFKMQFKKFEPYINPRFYCTIPNLENY